MKTIFLTCLLLVSGAFALSADDMPQPPAAIEDTETTTTTLPSETTTKLNPTADDAFTSLLNITSENTRALNLSSVDEVIAALANFTSDSRFMAVTTDEKTDVNQINADVCGRRNNKTSSLWKRFTSSAHSSQKDLGWMVLLQGSDGGVITGTLINSQWVLTRARGIESIQSAVIGAPINMQVRKVIVTVAHKDFDPVSRANDIGLIKLDKPVVYSEFTVPVCLPEPEEVNYLGLDGLVSTFVVHKDEIDAEELRKAQKSLVVLDNERCSTKLNQGEIHLNATIQVCSLHESKDAINEVQPVDLGTALTIKQDDDKWYAIGVASSAWAWANKYNYIIYTRVSSYVPWILNVIQNQ